ncbi:hypothetical protein FRB99_007277 [Tulasnella sp. 403]|nr:hypothetical protein FRB99_007277 [Tulasnella sp. 403]
MAGTHDLKVDADDHPVASVVVFRNQAEVTRSFPVELKTGSNKIVITSLPSLLQSSSVRVEGLGKGVHVLDVIHRPPKSTFFPAWNQTETKRVKELKARRKVAEAIVKASYAETNVLLEYAKSMKAEHISPEQFMQFMNNFRQSVDENLESATEKEKAVEEIDAAIKEEMDAPPTSDSQEHLRKAAVTVVVQANSDTSAELRLIYIVPSASWSPSYEIRASTDENGQLAKTVTIHHRAAIGQSSGEDWVNASITLSTSQPLFSQSTAQHEPIHIRTYGSSILPSGPGGFAAGNPTHYQQQQQAVQRQVMHQQQAQPTGAFQARASAPPQPYQSQPMPSGTANLSAIPLPPVRKTLFTGVSGSASNSLFGAPATNLNAPTYMPASPQYEPTSPVIIRDRERERTSPYAPPVFGAAPPPPPVVVGPMMTTTSAPVAVVNAPFQTAAFGASALAPDNSITVPSTGTDDLFSFSNATAATNAIAATYKIEGKTTIPSDSSTHQVVLSTSIELPTTVSVVTTPRVRQSAYLQARIKNTTNDALLPGHATVLNNESYVLPTNVPFVAPGDTFTCTLGVDDNVRISFVHKKEKPVVSSFTFAAHTESTFCTNTVRIKNARNFPINELIVRDSIPVASEPYKVILKNPADLATEDKDAGVQVDGMVARWSKEKPTSREEGLMEWVLKDVAAGAEKTIELVWNVHNPVGVTWGYSTT